MNRCSVEQAISCFIVFIDSLLLLAELFFSLFFNFSVTVNNCQLSHMTTQCCTVQLIPNTDIYSFSTVYVMFLRFSLLVVTLYNPNETTKCEGVGGVYLLYYITQPAFFY